MLKKFLNLKWNKLGTLRFAHPTTTVHTYISFILFICLFIPQAHADSINPLFKKIIQAQPYTFFCQLPISPKNKVDFQACGYCPIEQASVVAMPIVPFEQLAKNLPCYQHKICAKPNSSFYQGLSCCKKIDLLYQKMSQDLHNLVPETKHIKQLRAQKIPGILPNITSSLGCQALQTDSKRHVIHIPEAQRGMVARIYLYMSDTYQLKLDKELRQTLENWHALYGVTAWEKTRNRLIYNEQGTFNHWVETLAHGSKTKQPNPHTIRN